MTTDEHLKQIIGDLVIQLAILKAELDTKKIPAVAKEETK